MFASLGRAERTTRLVVKIVETSGDKQPGNGDEGKLMDLPPTLAIEGKKLPHLVVLSVFDRADASDSVDVVVQGESCRRIRLRVFEGQYSPTDQPAVPAAAAVVPPASNDRSTTPNEETKQESETTPAQWWFVVDSGNEETATLDSTEASTTQEEPKQEKLAVDTNPAERGDGTEDPAVVEREEGARLETVSMENCGGKAHFQRLALPSATLVGDYHIVCESVTSDSLPPVIINLSVV